jgi:hypothetical protein
MDLFPRRLSNERYFKLFSKLFCPAYYDLHHALYNFIMALPVLNPPLQRNGKLGRIILSLTDAVINSNSSNNDLRLLPRTLRRNLLPLVQSP